MIKKFIGTFTNLALILTLLTGCQQLRLDLFADNPLIANKGAEEPGKESIVTEHPNDPVTSVIITSTAATSATTSITASIQKGKESDLAQAGNSATDVAVPEDEINEDVQTGDEAVSGDIWTKVRAGFQLDRVISDIRIDNEVRWYVGHQDYIDRVVNRARRYLHYILSEVNRRSLPTELALLPIVESAFDPFAYSHGRAMGLWQFIPSTGRLYGLKKNWWYDGRRDVQAATGAALDYLEALHSEFDGDWLLALAAYNSGEGNVRSAIRNNRRLGKPVDFWSLKLLRETRTYVPRLLAISRLVADPEKFKVNFPEISDQPYWAQVDTGSQIDLSLAAQLAEISVEELYLLNPAFSRWATHPQGPHRLLIPVQQQQIFEQNLTQLSSEARVGWHRHKILSGENLGGIAWKYNTTVNTIKQINGLKGNLIPAGGSLLIPSALRDQDSYKLSRDQRLKATQAFVQNKHGSAPLKYTVVSGDNLWDISRKYRVKVRDLAKWNGLATTDLLHPGTQLSIWHRSSSNPLFESAVLVASINDNQRSEVIRKVNYRVRKGESLSLIANKFNLSVKKIKKWNRQLVGKQYIQPGQKLVLYVDVIQAE